MNQITKKPVGSAALSTLSAKSLAAAKQHAGLAISNDPGDQPLPMAYVLQSNSAPCDKRGSGHIPGAEPGHFWLRNAVNPIRSGVDGMIVIAVIMLRVWIAWYLNRGGFAGRYLTKPANVKPQIIEQDGYKKTIWLCDDGTELVETREIYTLIDGRPYIIPCSSTRHQFAREWMGYAAQLLHPETGEQLPLWAHQYLLTTVPTSNKKGSWFKVQFADAGAVSDEAYEQAFALYQIVSRGLHRIETPTIEAK
jgi:hypothetical protein